MSVGSIGQNQNNPYIQDDTRIQGTSQGTTAVTSLPPSVSGFGIQGIGSESIPRLPSPEAQRSNEVLNMSFDFTNTAGTVFSGVPSMGASMMAFIAEFSSEQRAQNSQLRFAQSEMIVGKMRDQADEMRAKAITNIVMGVVSGAMTIGQGVGSASMTTAGVKANSGLEQGARANADMLLNSKIQSFNSTMGGANQMIGGLTQGITGFMDANIKNLDADIEGLRAMIDTLKSSEDAFKEIIQKALQTQDAIQQNVNQTRTKIIG